jgi:acetolactate synthase-1/2/3 large subunit
MAMTLTFSRTAVSSSAIVIAKPPSPAIATTTRSRWTRPAAIAAALVHRDRPVVALVGDGGLAMTMAELETAVRVGARVIVVVFDNERYGTIRMWQERRGTGIGVATELGPVDFAAIARACGARGVRVERDDDFEPALRAALAADRATVIQLTLDRGWLSVDDLPA